MFYEGGDDLTVTLLRVKIEQRTAAALQRLRPCGENILKSAGQQPGRVAFGTRHLPAGSNE